MLTKACTRCGRRLPLASFWKQEKGQYGRRSRCISCTKETEYPRNRERARDYYAANPERVKQNSAGWAKSHPEKQREYSRAWRERNPEKRREVVLKHRYGMTLEDRRRLEERQGGRCAICGTAALLHIDHDHETGMIRGLLCGQCNRAIGLMGDDPDRLQAAAGYLAGA